MTRGRAAGGLFLVALAACGPAAGPAGADLQLGGSVPSIVAISIGQPGTFRATPGADAYALRVAVHVTSTVDGARLTIADGEDLSGPARGRLHDGSHLVGSPLAASVAGQAPQLLSAPSDPVLATFARPVSLAAETITLGATLTHAAAVSSRLHKLVWITISGPTP